MSVSNEQSENEAISALKVYFHKHLWLYFYCAKHRQRGSRRFSSGLCSYAELRALLMHDSVLLVLPPVKKFKQLLTTVQLCDIEIPDML